jgi:peptidoglycan/xylan/chitin deacetylase (PgdA/CDA1 family)
VRRLAAAVAVVALAGCGGGGSGSGSSDGTTAARAPAKRPGAGLAAASAPSALGAHPLTGAAAKRIAVPILMYHVVATPKPGVAYPDLFVPPARFAAELHALRGAGFHATTLDAVLRAWGTGSPLPRHPLVVSFDDGYLSQRTNAFPALRRLGWPGVLNLEIDNLQPGDLPAPLVRTLIRAGWEVDSHTVTHPDLTTVDDVSLRRELVHSKARLRRQFHVAARNFCYPAGRYDARVEAAVKAAGYSAATTEVPGWATPSADRYALPRIRVNGSDTAASVLRAVESSKPG